MNASIGFELICIAVIKSKLNFLILSTGEKLSAYEVGYRALVENNLFFDVNYYYNYTTNLRDDDFIVSDPD